MENDYIIDDDTQTLLEFTGRTCNSKSEEESIVEDVKNILISTGWVFRIEEEVDDYFNFRVTWYNKYMRPTPELVKKFAPYWIAIKLTPTGWKRIIADSVRTHIEQLALVRNEGLVIQIHDLIRDVKERLELFKPLNHYERTV